MLSSKWNLVPLCSHVGNFLFFPVLLHDVSAVSPAKPGGFALCCPVSIVPSMQLPPAPTLAQHHLGKLGSDPRRLG